MDFAATIRKKRRRRKISSNKSESQQRAKRTNRLCHLKDYCDDEGVARFKPEECLLALQKEVVLHHALTKKPATTQKSLLHLLRTREVGGGSGWNVSQKEAWQSQMLIRSLEEDEKPVTASNWKSRKEWRPYAMRTIPFTQLHTPSTDAILAMDRHGSYAIALSDKTTTVEQHNDDNANDNDTSNHTDAQTPGLALTFYGIPSKSRLEEHKRNNEQTGTEVQARVVSPLLQTITLFSKQEIESQCRTRNILGDIVSPVIAAPISILVSSDWKIGAAFLVDTIPTPVHRPNEDDDFPSDHGIYLGTIVVFPLPHHRYSDQQQPVSTLRVSGAPMGCFDSMTMRNLLWKVVEMPFKALEDESNIPDDMDYLCESLCDSIIEQPGYLLFNEEEKGFRLTWVTDSSWHETCNETNVKPLLLLPEIDKIPAKPNVVMTVDHDYDEMAKWKTCWNDRESGLVYNSQKSSQSQDTNIQGGFSIAFEAWISIANILEDMLVTRPGLSYLFSDDDDDPMPEYCYNLLSVNDGGRTADLVIVCKAKDQVGCLGIFVTLDLFTQRYRENRWMEHSNVTSYRLLRALCNSLALDERMRQRRLGPYAVNNRDKWGWGSTLCEQNDVISGYDFDMERDLDPLQWKPFVEEAKQRNGKVGDIRTRKIPYSSLYPDCDMFNNCSVKAAIPAANLTGRRAPVKIHYC